MLGRKHTQTPTWSLGCRWLCWSLLPPPPQCFYNGRASPASPQRLDHPWTMVWHQTQQACLDWVDRRVQGHCCQRTSLFHWRAERNNNANEKTADLLKVTEDQMVFYSKRFWIFQDTLPPVTCPHLVAKLSWQLTLIWLRCWLNVESCFCRCFPYRSGPGCRVSAVSVCRTWERELRVILNTVTCEQKRQH